MNRGKIKLYYENCHYATIWLDSIKEMKPNGAYWYIETKYGNIWGDCTCATITYDPDEQLGYFIEL